MTFQGLTINPVMHGITPDTTFEPLSRERIEAIANINNRHGRDAVAMAREILVLRAKVEALEAAITKQRDDLIAAAQFEAQLLEKVLTGEAAL